MWEDINSLYHQVGRFRPEEEIAVGPHRFCNVIKFGSHRFHGVSDDTLPHNEGWHFLQAGCALERAEMTARILDGARASGWRVNTAENPAERGGTVSVDCPHAFEVCRELLARDILVDYRPQAGIRISPHFYNHQEECDFALLQIEEILKTRAWEKHAVAASQA